MAATKLSLYRQALRLLGDARLALITDDAESRYALDDAWDGAVAFVLRQAPWRFALVETNLSSGGSPVGAFSHSYSYPTDWLRTHAVFVIGATNRQCPIVMRDQAGAISTNVTGVVMRYVSNAALDPAAVTWPEHFAQAVAAYLAFSVADKVTGERGAAARMSQLFSSILPQAVAIDALPEDEWLPFQRDGTLLGAGRHALMQRGWRFALKTAAISSTSGSPAPGYSYSFALPADWLRTWSGYVLSGARECPIDLRQQEGYWNTNTAAWNARYVSTDGLDTTTWPEPFGKAVLACLQFESAEAEARGAAEKNWLAALDAAAAALAIPDDPWLAHQLTGGFARAARQVIAAAAPRFAVKTAAPSSGGTPAAGYSNSFVQPGDWLRTLALYITSDGRECPFDVREQDTHWSTNVGAFTARYVSTAGLDATLWPETIANAVLAWLAAESAGANDAKAAWEAYAAVLAEAIRLFGASTSRWLPYQLDDRLARGAEYVLRQRGWRFALKSAAISSTAGTPASGCSFSFAVPSDWLRTWSAFVLAASGARENPVDIREQARFWSCNSGGFIARYISNTGLDSTLWPESFSAALLAYLQFEGAEENDREAAGKVFAASLELDPAEAAPEDPWLPHQLSGEFHHAAREVLSDGDWRFAIKTAAASSGGTPAPGYAYSFAHPSDRVRTSALYVTASGRECPFDVREQDTHWSANVAAFTARYVSDVAGLDANLWPEPFTRAVYARLTGATPADAEQKRQPYQEALAIALAAHGLPPNVWLPYQLDGSLLRAGREVLSLGDWRFALKRQAATAGGSAAPGYSNSFVQPDDYVRTHALYVLSGGRELPFDVRQHDTHWSANVAAFTLSYVSSTLGLDTTAWPEPFTNTVLAWLQTDEGAAGGDQPGKSDADGRLAAMVAAALRSHGVEPSPWLPFQLDGSFLRIALAMVDEAYWRFAIATPTLVTTTATTGEFSRTATFPNGWSRTRALFQLTPDGHRRPLDIRERNGAWYTNATSFYAEYVSATLAMDATRWPEHYLRAVLRALQLEGELAGDEQGAQIAATAYKAALDGVTDSEADGPDPWLPHQLDGSFARAIRAVIDRGNWTFAGALKSVDIDVSIQKANAADTGFPYRYALPSDLLRTHALYVAWDGRECPINIRQDDKEWSTDATAFTARYVAMDALVPTNWPEPVAQAVLAYLDWQGEPDDKENAAEEQTDAAEYERQLAIALKLHSIPDDPWLRFQLDGRYSKAVRMLLETGRWRFAVRTVILLDNTDPAAPAAGTPSPGYSYLLAKPNDWLRTLRLYYSLVDGRAARRLDIDYREEDDAFHANYAPLHLRYLTRVGLDSTKHTANFRDAALAWLQHIEARADPARGAEAAEKLKFYEMQCERAEQLDDERDMPRVLSGGRFAGARYSRHGYGYDLKNALPYS